MRDYILVYINGKRQEIRGEDCLISLSQYLRERLKLKGTKIVCEEGDCGACTVLKGKLDLEENKLNFVSINSCITYMFLLDCCHILTVDALNNAIQQNFVKHNSSQCGFCTPGFVMSMTEFGLKQKSSGDKMSVKKIKNALTGNLCRCTGYAQIIDAGLAFSEEQLKNPQNLLPEFVDNPSPLKEIRSHQKICVEIKTENFSLLIPSKMEELQNRNLAPYKIFSGSTDLGVQINKRKQQFSHLLSLNNLTELQEIKEQNDHIQIGSTVTIHQLQNYLKNKFNELSDFLNIFASPQIKNSATLVGNIVNASPIGDTLPPLLALDASINITDMKQIKQIKLKDFFLDYKKVNLTPGELILSIQLPLPDRFDHIGIYKVSKRKDLDISSVNATFLVNINEGDKKIKNLKLALGGVGPIPLRLTNIEQKFHNREWNLENATEICHQIKQEISPLADIRGSREFRLTIAKNLFRKFCFEKMGMEIK